MKMKISLRNILIPTDLYLMHFLKTINITFETYENEFNNLKIYLDLIPDRIIHGIDVYPYIYILHYLYVKQKELFANLFRCMILQLKDFIVIDIDIRSDFESYIRLFFKEVNIIYLIIFIQYYLV